MADVTLQAVITAKDEASAKLKGVQTSFGSLAGAVAVGQAAFAAFEKVTGSVIQGLKDSIRSFSEQEQATARLRAGLKNTTPEWQRGLDQLTRYASALQKTTTFADEQIVSAQAMLSTFMLNSDQIRKLTPSVLDMAAALEKTGGAESDLQSISILLGKAIGGEDIAGLTGALRRVGVVMTEHQTQILQTGTMTERLDTLTKVIAQNFGGFASETANTYTGKLRQMQNALDDVKEAVGGAVIPVLAQLATSLTAFVQGPAFAQTWREVGEVLRSAATAIRDGVKPAWDTMVAAVKNNLPQIQQLAAVIGGTAGTALVGALIVLGNVGAGIVTMFANMARVIDDVVEATKRLITVSKQVVGSPGQLGKLYTDFIQGLTGKKMQSGGPVQAGQPYIVGERQPELFVPSTSGRILPSVGGATVTVNFNNPVVRSDADLDTLVDRIKRELNREQVLAQLRV